MENADIARLLDEIADLLELGDENQFRIRAYRNAARTIWEKPEPLAEIALTDPAQLLKLQGIGKDIAAKITELVRTGQLTQLNELRQKTPPGLRDLMNVPGLGPKRAMQLFHALQIQSLEGLEAAAKAHKLRSVPGFGPEDRREAPPGARHPRGHPRSEPFSPMRPSLPSRMWPGSGSFPVCWSARSRAATAGRRRPSAISTFWSPVSRVRRS